MKKKKIIIALVCVCLAGILALSGINMGMYAAVKDRIVPPDSTFEDADCILVLGCQVKDDGVPSHMLEDRLKRGVLLYELGAAPKLLMSGDHGRTDYNEVGTMKAYAMDAGIPSEDIFMDHAGFSTYESIYRAKEIFCAKKVIIVTQKYHLYRALYIARALGLEAWGVDADYRSYTGQASREVREVLARVKDFGLSILQPKPTYLGQQIPITGSGDATNDTTLPSPGEGPLGLPTPEI